MNRILDELIQNSASCIEMIAKGEEWKRMNVELKDITVKSDDEGIKNVEIDLQ